MHGVLPERITHSLLRFATAATAAVLLRCWGPYMRVCRYGGGVLPGHPEGHPGLAKDRAASTALLAGKVATAVTAGHTVSVASQFCFDATTLISWLELTREAVSEAVTAAAAAQQQGEGADRRGDQYASNRVTYHVGIPGRIRTCGSACRYL